MKTNRLSYAERYRLICECKASGLTDAQWCIEHGIKPSTFYNWYSRLKAKGYSDFPKSIRFAGPSDNIQEVVKLDVIDSDNNLPIVPVSVSGASNTMAVNNTPAIEVSVGNISIKISNDVNPVLLTKLIEGLGGLSC